MERVVFVHGSVTNGDAAWAAQRPLANEFELVILNRPGFPPGPPVDRIDYEEHADWLLAQMLPGDHLCGHSYGGVVSLYAAARAPDVRSLTVCSTTRASSAGRSTTSCETFSAAPAYRRPPTAPVGSTSASSAISEFPDSRLRCSGDAWRVPPREGRAAARAAAVRGGVR